MGGFVDVQTGRGGSGEGMTSLETYLKQMREERPVAVRETSYYAALANLFNAAGDTLKPKIRYVMTPQGRGARENLCGGAKLLIM